MAMNVKERIMNTFITNTGAEFQLDQNITNLRYVLCNIFNQTVHLMVDGIIVDKDTLESSKPIYVLSTKNQDLQLPTDWKIIAEKTQSDKLVKPAFNIPTMEVSKLKEVLPHVNAPLQREIESHIKPISILNNSNTFKIHLPEGLIKMLEKIHADSVTAAITKAENEATRVEEENEAVSAITSNSTEAPFVMADYSESVHTEITAGNTGSGATTSNPTEAPTATADVAEDLGDVGVEVIAQRVAMMVEITNQIEEFCLHILENNNYDVESALQEYFH